MREFLILGVVAAGGVFGSVAQAFVPVMPDDFPKAVREKAEAATARVVRADGGAASGVLVKTSGAHAYLLTAAHAVADDKTVEVTLPGGRPLKGEVLARSADADLAVVRVPLAKGLPAPLPLAAAGGKPKQAVSVGWEKGEAPGALDEVLTARVKLRRPGGAAAVWCWATERKPARGRSGGPLVDETGAVAGVAAGHDDRAGYYTHPDEVHGFLKRNGLGWLAEPGK